MLLQNLIFKLPKIFHFQPLASQLQINRAERNYSKETNSKLWVLFFSFFAYNNQFRMIYMWVKCPFNLSLQGFWERSPLRWWYLPLINERKNSTPIAWVVIKFMMIPPLSFCCCKDEIWYLHAQSAIDIKRSLATNWSSSTLSYKEQCNELLKIF